MNRVLTKPKRKKIAAFVPNILGVSPGQRVRIESWERFLKQAGWEIEYFNFENESLHEILYHQGHAFSKIKRLIECYRIQLGKIIRDFSADVVFIYREAALIGPALPERLIARRKIPIIYDIDDPVFLPYQSPVNGWGSLLKFPRKTHKLFEMSNRIIAINNLIAGYAKRYNQNVTIVPNCVDTEKYKPAETTGGENSCVKMVWIGSHTTMQNLVEISAPLKKIQTLYDTPLLVIGAGNANLEGISVENRRWSAETEVADLQEGHIGLLPVNDLEWNHWKFFYKTVQYMAVGLPVIARDIGSNSEIIKDGVNGFVVKTEEQWFDRIKTLIENPDLRKKMGMAARQTVLERFSIQTQMPRLVETFENVLQQPDKN